VLLVCGQRAVCQRHDSLSDHSQQQQQHADSNVLSCHLQRELHLHVHESSIHLTSKLNNTFINKGKLLFIGM
jgi:hypothetical protein